MSEQKHTPGPWHIRHGVNVFHPDETMSGRSVATTGGFTTNVDDGEHILENQANARLIAAAPELLEACTEARRELAWLIEQVGANPNGSVARAFRKCTAAVAKATGIPAPASTAKATGAAS